MTSSKASQKGLKSKENMGIYRKLTEVDPPEPGSNLKIDGKSISPGQGSNWLDFAKKSIKPRKTWYPVIQRHRNDFSHDLYLLNRRHRQILRSMQDLRHSIDEADNQLRSWDDRSYYELETASSPPHFDYSSHQRKKRKPIFLDQRGGQRKGTISLLPPLSKDVSFLLSKNY